jgi:hypothetical protein
MALLVWTAPHGIECAMMRLLRTHQKEPPVDRIIRIGMDTSKHIFQLHGVNQAERPELRKKVRRNEMMTFFTRLEPTVIVTRPAPAQPEGSHEVGRNGQAGRALAATAADIPPMASRTLPRQTPKVGAVCGNSARTVLCGARPVMGVPTAICTNGRK